MVRPRTRPRRCRWLRFNKFAGWFNCDLLAALYMHLAACLREMAMPECGRTGHVAVRVSRGHMRDNGELSHDCGICGMHLD